MARPKNRTILIIDDNPDDLEYYTDLLKDSPNHYKVMVAETSEEGLKTFQKHKIDCTFVDYNLPTQDGIEVLEELMRYNGGKQLPILILTGERQQGVQAEAARKGALDYIIKGVHITPEQLDGMIQKVIDWAGQINKKAES